MKPKKSIQEQVQNELPEFVDVCNSLDEAQLNDRLAQLAKDLEAIEDAKEADDGLENARKVAIELGAPYRDGKKAIRLKSRYLISILKDRGKS